MRDEGGVRREEQGERRRKKPKVGLRHHYRKETGQQSDWTKSRKNKYQTKRTETKGTQGQSCKKNSKKKSREEEIKPRRPLQIGLSPRSTH